MSNKSELTGPPHFDGPPEDFRSASDQTEQGFFSRLGSRIQNQPIFPIGLGVFGCFVAFAAYNFKHRKVQASVYIMQWRVISQATAVGVIASGLLYQQYGPKTEYPVDSEYDPHSHARIKHDSP